VISSLLIVGIRVISLVNLTYDTRLFSTIYQTNPDKMQIQSCFETLNEAYKALAGWLASSFDVSLLSIIQYAE